MGNLEWHNAITVLAKVSSSTDLLKEKFTFEIAIITF